MKASCVQSRKIKTFSTYYFLDMLGTRTTISHSRGVQSRCGEFYIAKVISIRLGISRRGLTCRASSGVALLPKAGRCMRASSVEMASILLRKEFMGRGTVEWETRASSSAAIAKAASARFTPDSPFSSALANRFRASKAWSSERSTLYC